jgi:Peptidase family M28
MTRRTKLTFFLSAFWILVMMLACNLTTGDPPTIPPRASATPPATIGFEQPPTLSPEELPTAAVTVVAMVNTGVINLTNQVETDRLMLHVDTLQNLGTRHVNSPYDLPDRGIGAAYRYVSSQFEQIRDQSQGRLTVFAQPFSVTWAGVDSQAQNIIAFLSGTENGAGTILVGAHYDSTSIDFDSGSAYAPGANDNGSGVAALIEMARILSTRPHRTSIIFVAFSAEEIQRRGSIAFINDYMLPRQIDLNAMINMDIIGSQTGADGSMDDRNLRLFSAGPNDSPSRQLAREIELIALKHVPNMTIQLQDGIDRSNRYGDHQSFSDVGYPAVRFIESLEDVGRQHNDRDTIDDVQGAYLTRATQTILTVITALADGLRPPINIALREAGNSLRTLVWEPVAGASGYIVALRRPNALEYEYFEVDNPLTTNITWDSFVSDRFVGLAISAIDSEGLMGPLSSEFKIP